MSSPGPRLRQKDLFIYHGGCFDGFTAAYLWWEFHPEGNAWDYHGAVHGEMYGEMPTLRDVRDRDVVMVDFTYSVEEMVAIANAARSLLVLDHHKTSEDRIRAVRGLPGVQARFNNELCGAVMLWYYLREHGLVAGPPPDLLMHIEDRDLWRMRHRHTPYVSAYVASQPMTFARWRRAFGLDIEEIVERGAVVYDYIEQYGRKAREHAHMETIGGIEVPVMNLPYMNCSEHVTALLREHPDRPFAAGYFQRQDRRWQFSLRSREDFDVGLLAKTFGGGGHAGAAGFDVDKLPWEGKGKMVNGEHENETTETAPRSVIDCGVRVPHGSTDCEAYFTRGGNGVTESKRFRERAHAHLWLIGKIAD